MPPAAAAASRLKFKLLNASAFKFCCCCCFCKLLLLLRLSAAAALTGCRCCCSEAGPGSMLRCTGPLIGGHLLLLQVLLHAAASASGISVTSVARRRAAHVGPANHSQDCMPGRAPAALTVTRRSQCLNLKIQVVLLLRLRPAAGCCCCLQYASAFCSQCSVAALWPLRTEPSENY